MAVIPTPVAGERQSLLEYVKYHHSALLAVCDGLSDEQARSTPTVSTLCIGGLIKHITIVQYAWTRQVAVAPELLERDPWSLVGMMSHRDEQHVMRDDETLAELIASFDDQTATTLRVFADVDLDAAIVVPAHVRAVCENGHWTARWALMNINEETARHVGHADIIRESIDGATMFPPRAG